MYVRVPLQLRCSLLVPRSSSDEGRATSYPRRGDGRAHDRLSPDRPRRRFRASTSSCGACAASALWDREQDERSIVPHTVEEAYELADAAARGDDDRLADELGDVLFQVYFLSLLLEERDAGSLEAVADGLIRKLVRRHPHVFGAEASEAATRVLEDRPARTADDVRRNWERIKREVEDDGARSRPADPRDAALAALRAQGSEAGPRTGTASRSSGWPSRSTRSRGRTPRASAGAGADPDARDAVERALGETLLAIVDAARALDADPSSRCGRRPTGPLPSPPWPTRPAVEAISELVLEVADLERAREFYREVLGLEETPGRRRARGALLVPGRGPARLGLWTPQTGLAGGAAAPTSTSRSASPGRRSTSSSSASPSAAPMLKGRSSSAPTALSTSPTRTATWSSSGPRTCPSTRPRRARVAARGRSSAPTADRLLRELLADARVHVVEDPARVLERVVLGEPALDLLARLAVEGEVHRHQAGPRLVGLLLRRP